MEIKSFLADSVTYEFHAVLGQFMNYRYVLEENEPDRTLYMAVPAHIYDSFFKSSFGQMVIRKSGLRIVSYDSEKGGNRRMDKLEKYRSYVTELIDKYGNYRPACGDIETQKVCDEKNDHYQVVSVGWHDNRRVYGCSLHIDIKNNKIWIQHNGTDRSIADELTELGVQKEDIVLGFHTPYMRQFTDYATS